MNKGTNGWSRGFINMKPVGGFTLAGGTGAARKSVRSTPGPVLVADSIVESNTSLPNTSSGTATEIISSGDFYADGATYYKYIFTCARMQTGGTGGYAILSFYDAGVNSSICWDVGSAQQEGRKPLVVGIWLPAAGIHNVSIRGWNLTSTATCEAQPEATAPLRVARLTVYQLWEARF